MRREIDWGNGLRIVFQDCGPDQFVIDVLGGDLGGPPTDAASGRRVLHSLCLPADNVDVLEEAIKQWRRERSGVEPLVLAAHDAQALPDEALPMDEEDYRLAR